MTGKYDAGRKVLSRHNILGSRHAKHLQHKSLGHNIKNEAATRKQAKWRQNSIATAFLGRDRDDKKQDSVTTRTLTEMLSRQEKLGHDTNLKKHLSSTVATRKVGRKINL